MVPEKEIEQLLKNIQKGLKVYTVKELNQGLVSLLHKKDDKSSEINYVIGIVCGQYNISVNTLKSKNARGVIQEAKQICYCLLHFNLGISIRQIADKVFNNWPTSVSLGVKKYKTADSNHKADKTFLNTYSVLQEKLIHHLKQSEKFKH